MAEQIDISPVQEVEELIEGLSRIRDRVIKSPGATKEFLSDVISGLRENEEFKKILADQGLTFEEGEASMRFLAAMIKLEEATGLRS